MSFFLRFVDERPTAAVNAAINTARQLASDKFRNMGFEEEWAEGGYGISSIRPHHIQCGGATWAGSHHWGISYAASETWTAWISVTQSELAYEIITGMFNLAATPITTEIYMTLAGKALPTLNIEEIYAYDISRLFWRRPVVIQPEKPWDFNAKAVGGIGTERLGLTGYTIGTHAYLILRA